MFASLIIKELVINNDFTVLSLAEKVENLSSLGIRRLVIAPFYYDEESHSSIKEVNDIVEDLKTYLSEKQVDIKLYTANAVRANFENIKDFLENKIGTINNTSYILLNNKESNSMKELTEIIYEFNLRNYIPIIFGPEKFEEIQDNTKNINKLLKENCLFQLDIESLNGKYGKKILK